jgi:hypothetical protein
MYVPSNFTANENTVVEFKNCSIFMHDGINMLHANVFKDSFQGNVELEGWDIYTEDEPVVFLDKIESYIKQEERLI